MAKAFPIVFDFPLDNSSVTLHLTAQAELHHSSPYYVVNSFQLQNAQDGHNSMSILPQVEIEKIDDIWVHRDSGRTSLLSIALGKAIDEHGRF